MDFLLNYKRHSISSYKTRLEKIDNQEYIVVPVVLIKEGVLNGSNGPIFYSAESISSFHNSWNKMPVTLGHPPKGVSDPVTFSKSLGYVWNVFYDESTKSLKGEIWFDSEKLKNKHNNIYSKIMNGESIEVSTGLNSPVEVQAGSFNGKDYYAKTTYIIPDHLAVLLDEQGACSLEDGCGIRNKKNSKGDGSNDSSEEDNMRQDTAPTLTNGDKDMDKNKTCGCSDKIAALLKNKAFSEDQKEILEKTENIILDKILNMEAEKEQLQKEIAEKNEAIKKKEESLKAKEEEIKNASSKKEEPKEVNFEQLLNSAPAPLKESIEAGLRIHNQSKQALIEKISNHKGSKLDKSLLEGKSLAELEGIASLIPAEEKTVSFEGRVFNASYYTANSEVEALPVPTFKKN